jgi:arsenate reductase
MSKIKVLFVCVHNSARSQMSEAFLNHYFGERFEAESAGIEPGKLNPVVVNAMKEIGIDISGNKTKSVFDYFMQGKRFEYVITVCDKKAAERCPIFPGVAERIHWSFSDPSALQGSYEEKLEGTRKIRDQIKDKVKLWAEEITKISA